MWIMTMMTMEKVNFIKMYPILEKPADVGFLFIVRLAAHVSNG